MNFSARSYQTWLLAALMLSSSSSSVGAFNLPTPGSSSSNPARNPNADAPTTADNNGLKATSVGGGSEEWRTTLSEMVRTKIGAAEDAGSTTTTPPTDGVTKDEIVATALAGSVLGTAVGSPLLIGAAIGLAGSHILTGENGEKARQMVGKAGRDLLEQATAAIAFTQEQLAQEKDLSSASKKILLAIQDRASEVQTEFQSSNGDAVERLKGNLKKTVESEEFKTLPNRSFQAVRAFVGSEEVKKASGSVMQAIKDGLESDEMKALQSRATQAIKDTIQSKE
jgi:gas vesicle protein